MPNISGIYNQSDQSQSINPPYSSTTGQNFHYRTGLFETIFRISAKFPFQWARSNMQINVFSTSNTKFSMSNAKPDQSIDSHGYPDTMSY
jgi:hypothetical protein